MSQKGCEKAETLSQKGCEKAETLFQKGCEKAKTLSKILFSTPQISESIPFLFIVEHVKAGIFRAKAFLRPLCCQKFLQSTYKKAQKPLFPP